MGPEFFLSSVRVGGTELSLSIVMGIIAAVIASAKGRSVIAWFFIGLITSCLGVLVLTFLPDLNEVEADRQSRDDEMRRTKERLHQEQARQRTFQSQVLGRLDSHDVALGIDTRKVDGPLAVADALAVEGEVPEWFYEDQGHPAGPITRRSLRALLNSGAIDPLALVWHPDFGEQWRPIGELPDFRST